MSRLSDELLEQYGPLLSTADLAKVFRYKDAKYVQESIHRETFPDAANPLPVKRIGKRLYARHHVVAEYLENLFEEAG